MARYFFHLADGGRKWDRDGVELPSLAEARVQAVVFAGERLRERPAEPWDGCDWRVEVTDQAGVLLLTVIVVVVDAPVVEVA